MADAPLRVGDVLAYADGWFSVASIGTVTVEAIGPDWVVARSAPDHRLYPGRAFAATSCDPDFLTQCRINEETL